VDDWAEFGQIVGDIVSPATDENDWSPLRLNRTEDNNPLASADLIRTGSVPLEYRRSRNGCFKHIPDVVSVQDLHAHDLVIYDIENDRALPRRHPYISMIRTEAPRWFGLCVESGAEVVATSATVYYVQTGNLRRQLWLLDLNE
jgi:hypothetical protein